MRNAVLIANPRAGQGGPEKRREAILQFCRLLKAHGVREEALLTQRPNDATRLAAEAANQGIRNVIISGGDGTINEARRRSGIRALRASRDGSLNRLSSRLMASSIPRRSPQSARPRTTGGKLAITPRARMDRPGFEICMIHSTHRRHYLQMLPFALLGGIPEGKNRVTFLKATKARAIGEGMQVQVDGELVGELPMTFTISRHAIEVIVPARVV